MRLDRAGGPPEDEIPSAPPGPSSCLAERRGDLVDHGSSCPLGCSTEPGAELHVLGLDAPEPETDASHLGVGVGDPAQGLGQAQVVHRGVPLWYRENLVMVEAVDRAGSCASDHGVDHPDLALTAPELGQDQRVALGLDHLDSRRQVGGAETVGDLRPHPVVTHEAIAEARDQDAGAAHIRTTWTEQEMHGS